MRPSGKSAILNNAPARREVKLMTKLQTSRTLWVVMAAPYSGASRHVERFINLTSCQGTGFRKNWQLLEFTQSSMTQLPGVPQESGRKGVRHTKSASHRCSESAHHVRTWLRRIPPWPTSYMCLVATCHGLTRPELSNLAANPLVFIGISPTAMHTYFRHISSHSTLPQNESTVRHTTDVGTEALDLESLANIFSAQSMW